MNPSEGWRRDRVAWDRAVILNPHSEGGGDWRRPRQGVCKITASGGDGSYTVTEQWYDVSGGTWSDAYTPLGYVGATAYDINASTTGVTGERFFFWEQRTIGGSLVLMIDIARFIGNDWTLSGSEPGGWQKVLDAKFDQVGKLHSFQKADTNWQDVPP